MTPDCEPTITDKEAAAILGMCLKSFQRKAAKKEVPAFKLGNKWKSRKSWLDAYIESQVLSPASGGTRQ